MTHDYTRMFFHFETLEDKQAFKKAFPGAFRDMDSKYHLDAIVSAFFVELNKCRFNLPRLCKRLNIGPIRTCKDDGRACRHINFTSTAAKRAYEKHRQAPSYGVRGLLTDFVLSKIGQDISSITQLEKPKTPSHKKPKPAENRQKIQRSEVAQRSLQAPNKVSERQPDPPNETPEKTGPPLTAVSEEPKPEAPRKPEAPEAGNTLMSFVSSFEGQ